MTEAPPASSTTPLTRGDRLDRLPFGRPHLRVLVASGVGWALDAMDVILVSFVIAALGAAWALSPGELSLIVSIGFVGMAFGATVGGLLADRFGRRTVFAVSLLVFGVATGLSSLAWSLGALLVLRALAGFGMGAELPVASTYVSEFAPARIRGRAIVFLEAFWAVGAILAALVGYFVVPSSPDGWRWALLIGAIPALWAGAVRFGMPESVRFLEQRGRFTEAEAVVRRFERESGIYSPESDGLPETGGVDATQPGSLKQAALPSLAADSPSGLTGLAGPADAEQPIAPEPSSHRPADSAHPAPPATSPAAPAPSWTTRLAALWAPGHRTTTAALWIVWFCVNFAYYGAFIWIPSILVAQGLGMVRSFEFTLIITLAQLPGYLASAWLVEAWGRRPTLAVFLAGSALSAIAFGNADGVPAIIGFGMALSFFNLGAWGALYAITPEVYPTRVRGTGAGWAAGVGRIASILAPLIVPPLLAAGGAPLLFVVFSLFFAIAVAATLLLSERRGRPLD